jgi:hypothetical protein
MAVLPTGLAKSLAEDYTIDQSLRFDEAGYLSRTPSSTGDVGEWTLSVWIKVCDLPASGAQVILGSDGTPSTGGWIRYANQCLNLELEGTYNWTTDAVFRDPSAWYHVVVAYDNSQSTATTKCRIYVNGVEQSLSASSNTVVNTPFNTTSFQMNIGRRNRSDGSYIPFDGYMAEFYWIDGTQYAASDFAETDSTTNEWKPIDASDLTFGTNGFYQKYAATELANSFTDFDDITALGGGCSRSATGQGTLDGGSGGGGSTDARTGGSATQGDSGGGTGYGNDGGEGFASGNYAGGGGGGANAAGSDSSITVGGDGGAGKLFSTFVAYGTDSSNVASTGSNGGYFGGGAGGSNQTGTGAASTGGVGGGGNGIKGNVSGNAGMANTGGGGSGSGESGTGGAGGSGVVLIKYTGHTITANGGVTQTRAVKKVGDSSIVFDGTGDYLSIPSSQDFNFGSGDFTIEMWVNFDDITSGTASLWSFNQGDNDTVLKYKTDVGIAFYHYPESGSSWNFSQGSTSGWATGTWYHIALVRNGTFWAIYRDGIIVATHNGSETLDYKTRGLTIGCTEYTSGIDEELDGYMDEQRTSDVARYDFDFTAPTSAFTNDSYTKLLLHMDGSDSGTTFTDSSGSAHTVTAVGDAHTDTTVKKVGTASGQFDGTGDWLTVPDSSDFDIIGSDFTIECWVKPNSVRGAGTPSSTWDYSFAQHFEDASNRWVFGHAWNGDSGSPNTGLYFGILSGGSWLLAPITPDNNAGEFTTTDWHHCAVTGSSSGVYSVFLDGVLVNTVTQAGSADFDGTLYIGQRGNDNDLMNGYIDELRLSKGVIRYASTFTPQTTEFTTDANTMLLIHSNWDGGLGADSSGNANDFTATNLVATDQMKDSPTNNFATMVGPLVYNSVGNTYSEGNLKVAGNATDSMAVFGTIYPPETGKWYFEAFCTGTTDGSYPVIGVADYGYAYANWTNWSGSGFGGTPSSNNTDGEVLANGGQVAEPNWDQNDIVGIAIDNDNGAVYWSKNGTWYDGTSGHGSSDPESGGSKTGASKTWTAGTERYGPAVNVYETAKTVVFNFGSDSSFAGATSSGGNSDTNSIGDFKYAVPSGYSAICTSNLPDPEIKLPGDNFDVQIWTGTAATKVITTGFQTDFVWGKNRNGTSSHCLMDSLRGTSSTLKSNSNAAVETASDVITSFDATGYTLGDSATGPNLNQNGSDTFVGWAWKGGGAPTATNSAGAGATPTAGSVKIDGSNLGSALAGTLAVEKLTANTASGFSVIGYTGDDTTGSTIAHGLSQAPELVFVKGRDSVVNWGAYRAVSGGSGNETNWAQLNTNHAFATSGPFLFVNSTTLGLVEGSYANLDGEKTLAYCFHSVEGYSKVGSYEGNGDDPDGPFVYCGFRPAMTIIKSVDQARDWWIMDNKRDPFNSGGVQVLWPNDNGAEGDDYTGYNIDYVSNGFKITGDNNKVNESGQTYLFYAVSEFPFKFSNAR